jgi:Ca2+/H+ antiporter
MHTYIFLVCVCVCVCVCTYNLEAKRGIAFVGLYHLLHRFLEVLLANSQKSESQYVCYTQSLQRE